MSPLPKLRHTITGLTALTLLAGPCWSAEPADAAAKAREESERAAAQSREETERALAAAQQRLDVAVREVEQLSSQLGAQFGQRFIHMTTLPPRAMLGVQVRAKEGTAGAEVVAVSPGGPAQAAGIKEGDLITAVAGKDLAKSGDPGRELAETLRAQGPDSKVKVRIVRDGKPQPEVEVAMRPVPQTLQWRGPPGGPFGPGHPQGPAFMPRAGMHEGDGPDFEPRAPLAGMELATLSEGLGTYFGAKKGVLVVRAGRSEGYKLKDGDVILAIDGREPNSASHATRILRSYQHGEKLQLKVLRERKPVTLDVTLPGA